MTTMLYILILLSVAAIFAFFLDWGHKDELELNSNVIGFGKAKGLYIIKMENYYVVAGMRVKSKRKAVKEFMKLVEDNGFMPPGMYFKTFANEPVKPAVRTVKIIEKQNIKSAPARESRSPGIENQRSAGLSAITSLRTNPPEAGVKQDERGNAPHLKPNNGLKPKRR